MVSKPILIYDGDCFFCRTWIERWKKITGGRVDYAPYQEAAARFSDIPMAEFQRSVQYITPAGQVYAGAEAVFRTLAEAPGKGALWWLYRRLPGFKPVSEALYRIVAGNRSIASRLTRLLWGTNVNPPSYHIARWVFIRLLGLIYLLAFLSLVTQILGLIGSNGILPAQSFLNNVDEEIGAARFHRLPTLFWLSAGDAVIRWACGGGAALSLLVLWGLAPAPLLFLLWALYLSVVSVGGDFLSFQWDGLLLETGFLAIFFAPLHVKPAIDREAEPPRSVHWLLRWLLFRLMFSSGVVKLLSGDETWRSLRALTFHYETQPLPNAFSWYAHHLSAGFHRFSALSMFAVELLVPFLIFAPRRLRTAAGAVLVSLQIIIALTGNYCFFNFLAIALCLLLIDDSSWGRMWSRLRSGFGRKVSRGLLPSSRPAPQPGLSPSWPKWFLGPLAGVIFTLTLMITTLRYGLPLPWPTPLKQVYFLLAPFHSLNNYGLFAVMTSTRDEIIMEGSNDGKIWLPYEFKHKPGDLRRRPTQVAPHQPRLDWQMWFAALGRPQENPWFMNFSFRLLQGSPEVLALLKTNPFPSAPPRYLRAVVYDYRFSDPAARKKEGVWWRRELKGLYCPVLSLRPDQ